jgi:hypothetical protein
MRDGGKVIGALNIYSRKPREWADQDIAVAVVLADVATSYVLNVAKLHDQADVVVAGVYAHELVGVIDRVRFPWATPRAVGSAALMRIALPIYGYAT